MPIDREILELVLKRNLEFQRSKREFYYPLRVSNNDALRVAAEWSEEGIKLVERITDEIEKLSGESFTIGRAKERT